MPSTFVCNLDCHLMLVFKKPFQFQVERGKEGKAPFHPGWNANTKSGFRWNVNTKNRGAFCARRHRSSSRPGAVIVIMVVVDDVRKRQRSEECAFRCVWDAPRKEKRSRVHAQAEKHKRRPLCSPFF